MGETWRERIAEARERGQFTKRDRVAMHNPMTCMLGEVAHTYSLRYLGLCVLDAGRGFLDLELPAVRAVDGNDFAAAERLLDAIEDRALELKRSVSESGPDVALRESSAVAATGNPERG